MAALAEGHRLSDEARRALCIANTCYPTLVVEQRDAETGVLLARWPSAADTGRSVGLSRTNVGNALRGQNRTAGGFRWSHAISLGEGARAESVQEEDEDDEDGAAKPKRVVEQLDGAGAVLARWPSATSAARGLGIYRDSVSAVLRGEQTTAGGFKWQRASPDEDRQAVGGEDGVQGTATAGGFNDDDSDDEVRASERDSG